MSLARALLLHLRSEDPQYLVTGKMPVVVVDRLEVVKIAHDHADWMPRTLCEEQLASEAFLEESAVV